MKKKRFLSMLLALALLAALLPAGAVTAYAAPATSVTVNGATLNADTPYWKNGATTATNVEADWNAKFEADTGTLTLKNATITKTASWADGGTFATIGADSGLALKGALTIGGGGTLDMSGFSGSGNEESPGLIYAIVSNGLTMTGGTLTTNSYITAMIYGLVSIEGGTLRCTATGDQGGFVCDGSDFSLSGGTVELAAPESIALACSGTLSFSGGTITMQGREPVILPVPTLDDGVAWTITASTGYNGTPAVDYDPADIVNYKYLRFAASSAPARRSGGGNSSTKNTAYSDDDNVKVTVEDGDVEVTKLAPGDEDYDLLLKSANGTPLMAYEIDATDGEDGGRIMFFVGRENAGKQYTVLHRLPDGTIEEYHVICAANGWITVIVDSLSPFMVFEGNVKASGTAVRVTSDDNPDTGANDFVGIATALAVMAALGCVVLKRKE